MHNEFDALKGHNKTSHRLVADFVLPFQGKRLFSPHPGATRELASLILALPRAVLFKAFQANCQRLQNNEHFCRNQA